MSLERLWLAAWLEGLHAKPAIRPQEPLLPVVRLDDTGRPPHVPLRPNRGGTLHVGGQPPCGCGVTAWHWHGDR